MRKVVAGLTLAVLILGASPVLADNDDEGDRGGREGRGEKLEVRGSLFGAVKGWRWNLPDDRFELTGTLAAKTSNSVTLNVLGSIHVASIVNGQTTAIVNADTKIMGRKGKNNLTLADLVVGDKLFVSGTVSGSTLTATRIWAVDKKDKPAKVSGKVTAKTNTSVTVTNGLTATSQTVTTDENTKVLINGETKTTADINVGDSGWVKFKNVAGSMIARIVVLFR
jgi:hypothetical protein